MDIDEILSKSLRYSITDKKMFLIIVLNMFLVGIVIFGGSSLLEIFVDTNAALGLLVILIMFVLLLLFVLLGAGLGINVVKNAIAGKTNTDNFDVLEYIRNGFGSIVIAIVYAIILAIIAALYFILMVAMSGIPYPIVTIIVFLLLTVLFIIAIVFTMMLAYISMGRYADTDEISLALKLGMIKDICSTIGWGNIIICIVAINIYSGILNFICEALLYLNNEIMTIIAMLILICIVLPHISMLSNYTVGLLYKRYKDTLANQPNVGYNQDYNQQYNQPNMGYNQDYNQQNNQNQYDFNNVNNGNNNLNQPINQNQYDFNNVNTGDNNLNQDTDTIVDTDDMQDADNNQIQDVYNENDNPAENISQRDLSSRESDSKDDLNKE